MNKTFSLMTIGTFFLITLMSFSSASYYGGYYDPYYGQGNYDAYHSYTTRTQGGFYGPRTTTTTQYDKVNEQYWNGHAWVDRTVYVKEKKEIPSQGYYPGYSRGNYYGGYNYPSYDYRGYNTYYNNYNYPRYSYW